MTPHPTPISSKIIDWLVAAFMVWQESYHMLMILMFGVLMLIYLICPRWLRTWVSALD